MQQQGHPLSDNQIKDQAISFAKTVRPSYLDMLDAAWIERFKTNGIGEAEVTRGASESNIFDHSSLNSESAVKVFEERVAVTSESIVANDHVSRCFSVGFSTTTALICQGGFILLSVDA